MTCEVDRKPALAAMIALAFLAGCASGHPATVADFRDFLLVRAPVAEPVLVATFFETGLGDAILLEFPSGSCLLIDAGVGWYSRFILNYLAARRIEKLDGLLLTHPHRDHYGGMKEVIEAIPVHRFFHNGVAPSREDFAELREAVRSRSIPETVLRRGDELTGLSGLETRVEVLYPDEKALTLRSDLNGGSIVLRVTHGGVVFLLMGDAEDLEESRLLEFEGGSLRADVLKVGHHGSIGSGSTAFFKAVRPKIAIVQGTQWVDVHPFYPRPSYHIRSTLASMGVPLLKTKHEGTVQVISDGTAIHWQTMRHARGAIEELRRY
jgi:competence protein ComEC